jgi:type I restriction enzyme M protein
VLRDDGVTYHQYVTELTYLLFLKMEGEEDRPWKRPKKSEPAARRATAGPMLNGASAPERLEFYKEMLLDLPGQHGRRAGAGDLRQRQHLHHQAGHAVQAGDRDRQARLVQRQQDGLGDLYEGLLEKNASEKKSGAGQYFTPRVR